MTVERIYRETDQLVQSVAPNSLSSARDFRGENNQMDEDLEQGLGRLADLYTTDDVANIGAQ